MPASAVATPAICGRTDFPWPSSGRPVSGSPRCLSFCSGCRAPHEPSLNEVDSRRIHLGVDATETRAKATGRRVRYLHFATHGVLDPRFPLDSGLVLTRSEAAGNHSDNGFLQAWEIFESLRVDAEMVVLSACETGLGEIQGGEGLIGLTRAFHYAGARSVLSTLWRVDDEATADLIVRVYRHLRAGHSKADALRAAQLDFIRGTDGDPGIESTKPGDVSAPYFWAAFQLHGDWR